MKKIFTFAAVVCAAMMMVSCGASKKVAQAPAQPGNPFGPGEIYEPPCTEIDTPEYFGATGIAIGAQARIAELQLNALENAKDMMKKMTAHAEENQALAAINGSFYDMQKGNSVCFLKIGKEVIDTTTTREFELRVTGAVQVYKKKLKVLPWNKQIESKYRKNKGAVLASGPLLIEDGEVCSWEMCDSSFVVTKHPRSAVFTTKDKRTVFITVDGRSKGNAIGVSLPELAHLIRILGGEDALNLDGGGSTTLWMKGAPDNGVVNYPSDNGKFDHQGERKIPNAIYVY